MQIEFDDFVHRDRPDTESAIIDDVVAGRYDMAWVAQRPWPERGIHAFDALVAPLLIDTYALEGAVLADPIVDEMLSALDGSGVVGLGIVPGPIRYAATREEPLLDLESFMARPSRSTTRRSRWTLSMLSGRRRRGWRWAAPTSPEQTP